MDKILFVDLLNQIHRANISFGPPLKHDPCLGCDTYISLHQQNITHCICGAQFLGDLCEIEEKEHEVIVYNFFRNLRPLIELFSPDKAYFVLEGHPQFRYDLFADYKANRIEKYASKNKEKVFKAKDIIIKLLQYLQISIVRAANYEADDVIHSLAGNMKDEQLTIISNDSDFIQILQKGYVNCQIYNPIKKVFMTAPDYNYIAWKCLNGDKSDNIPSLLKPKKAIATVSDPILFKKFLSVEENRANFSINRQLIEFRDVPMEELTIIDGNKNYEQLKEEFSRMKFESIINVKSWPKFWKTFECLKY